MHEPISFSKKVLGQMMLVVGGIPSSMRGDLNAWWPTHSHGHCVCTGPCLLPPFPPQVDGVTVNIALQWCSDSFSDNILGFVNSVKTVDGGTHIDGFKSALTRIGGRGWSVGEGRFGGRGAHPLFSGDMAAGVISRRGHL